MAHYGIVFHYADSEGIIEVTQFSLAWQLFIQHGAPDVPLNMVASYHTLDGKRSTHHYSKHLN